MFDSTVMVLMIGDVDKISWTFTPANSVTAVTLSSSIPSVAMIDENGTVTALSEGMTILSLETDDGRQAYLSLRVRSLKPRPG